MLKQAGQSSRAREGRWQSPEVAFTIKKNWRWKPGLWPGEPPQLRETDKGGSVSSSPWATGMLGTKAEGEEPRDFSESTKKRAKALGRTRHYGRSFQNVLDTGTVSCPTCPLQKRPLFFPPPADTYLEKSKEEVFVILALWRY